MFILTLYANIIYHDDALFQIMYTLLSGYWKYFFQKEEYNVLILGLDNAGKTVSTFTCISHLI